MSVGRSELATSDMVNTMKPSVRVYIHCDLRHGKYNEIIRVGGRKLAPTYDVNDVIV